MTLRQFILFPVYLGFLAVGVVGGPGEVDYIPSRDYAAVVQREISQAKSSVTVCLYRIALQPHRSDSPVMRLAESLRKAHAAGVGVDVFLDQNVPFPDEEGSDTGRAESAKSPLRPCWSAARRVYDNNHLTGINPLIDLNNTYGRARVDAALKSVGQKNPDIPLDWMANLIVAI